MESAIKSIRNPEKRAELQKDLDALKGKVSEYGQDNNQTRDEQGLLERGVRDLGEKIIKEQFPLAALYNGTGFAMADGRTLVHDAMAQNLPLSTDPFSPDFAKWRPYQAPPDSGGAGGNA